MTQQTAKVASPSVDNSHLDDKNHPKWDLIKLKKSIPDEFFEADTKTSLYYAFRSFFLVGTLAAAYNFSLGLVDNFIIRTVISLAYWFAQGTVFWGIFTIGHDCGHRSFSNLPWLNDLVGTIWHGFILVPYFPWKVSHAHHHKNTGNIEVDEIFHPIKESESQYVSAQANAFIKSYFFFGLGWMAYLISGYPGVNYSRSFGGNKNDGPCHFNPNDKMFNHNLFLGVTSVLFVFGMIVGIIKASMIYSFATVAQYYLIPQFVFACYLLLVTFLHHASPTTRWLSPSEWNYSRGQLENTVDRDYGSIINNISHNIGTHVVHHLFPVIPHYKLVDANVHLKKYTTENNLPHNEVVHKISTLADYMTESKNYGNNYIVPDDVLIYSTSTGKIHKRKSEKTEKQEDVVSNADVMTVEDDAPLRQRAVAN